MNNASKLSSLRGNKAPDQGIEWEVQPSLQHLVVRTDAANHDAPTWAETMPVSIDVLSE